MWQPKKLGRAIHRTTVSRYIAHVCVERKTFTGIKISPFIMCCKVEGHKLYLELLERAQLDSIRFDIMDGVYIKGIMLGTPIYKDIKRLSKPPVDMHIM